jgi:hypothetical protein
MTFGTAAGSLSCCDAAQDDGHHDMYSTASSAPVPVRPTMIWQDMETLLRPCFEKIRLQTLKTIVSLWIRMLEPFRNRKYGKYDGKIPCNAAKPPWWPSSVAYREPHVLATDGMASLHHEFSSTDTFTGLVTLAIGLVAAYRKAGKEERKDSWIEDVRHATISHVRLLDEQQFTRGKNPEKGPEAKQQLIEITLPKLFDVIKDNEGKIIQQNSLRYFAVEDPSLETTNRCERVLPLSGEPQGHKRTHNTELHDVTSELVDSTISPEALRPNKRIKLPARRQQPDIGDAVNEHPVEYSVVEYVGYGGAASSVR